jgi:hypothetical protein
MEVIERYICDSEHFIYLGNSELIRIAEIRKFSKNGDGSDYRLVTYFPKSPQGKIIHGWARGENAVYDLRKSLGDLVKKKNYELIPQP